ncbi:Receptor-like protein 45, partial [Clarias magur]
MGCGPGAQPKIPVLPRIHAIFNSVRSVCRWRKKTIDVTERRLSALQVLSVLLDLGRRE